MGLQFSITHDRVKFPAWGTLPCASAASVLLTLPLSRAVATTGTSTTLARAVGKYCCAPPVAVGIKQREKNRLA